MPFFIVSPMLVTASKAGGGPITPGFLALFAVFATFCIGYMIIKRRRFAGGWLWRYRQAAAASSSEGPEGGA